MKYYLAITTKSGCYEKTDLVLLTDQHWLDRRRSPITCDMVMHAIADYFEEEMYALAVTGVKIVREEELARPGHLRAIDLVEEATKIYKRRKLLRRKKEIDAALAAIDVDHSNVEPDDM